MRYCTRTRVLLAFSRFVAAATLTGLATGCAATPADSPALPTQVTAVTVSSTLATASPRATPPSPDPSGSGGAASPSADGAQPTGGRVARTIDIATDGEVIYEHGALWVEDRGNQVLRQIDPSTGVTVRDVNGVLGGYMTYQDGLVWMSSFVLDGLLRIDPVTNDVRTIDTGEGQAGTSGVAGTRRGVWAANHYLGTIVLYDRAGKVQDTVKVSPRDIMGPQAMATDAKDVWVNVPEQREVVAVRIADGKVVHHVPLGWMPSGSLCTGAGRVWVTGAGDGPVDEVDAESGKVLRTLDVGGPTGRCVLAFGSLWFPTLDPVALVRVDPQTGTVIGRLALAASGGATIAASEGRLWVRVDGKLLEIEPNTR